MKNTSLNDVSVFVEVARANGFRAAAENLNLGAGSVSETIRRMEERLGVRLIERTTRQMSLTSAGEKLFQRTLPALNDLQSALDELEEDEDTLSGTLRLSAPRSSSSFFLDKLIAAYCARFPTVNIEIMYDDEKVDLVTSGIDAAIRSQNILDNETHAVEVGPNLRLALVASPAYLERHSKPRKPTDLTNHDGIRYGFGRADQLAPWTFWDENKETYMVNPRQRMVVNDLESAIQFATAGIGLAYLYRKPAEPLIESGELVTLFERRIPPLPRYTINYLTKRHMPARLRSFIDIAKMAR